MPIPFALAAILLTVLPSAAVQEDQPLITFPFKIVSQFSIQDRETTGYQKAIFSDPVIDERRVYFAGTNGVLYARYKDTFQSAWSFSVREAIQLSLLLAPDDRIVLAAGASVYCLRRVDGVVLWIADTANPVTAGVLGDGERAIVADSAGGVLCLSTADGSIVWRQPGIGEASAAIRSQLLANEGIVYAGSDAGMAIALSLRDGRIVWTARAAGPVRSGFAIDRGRLFFGSDDNYVYAVNAGSGELIWRQRTPGDVSGRPVVTGDTLHITARDRTIRLFNCSNGHPLDQSPIPLTENFDTRPLVTDELIIYPQKNMIFARALQQNYITRGAHMLPAEISTAIVRDGSPDSLFYLGTRNGEFLAIAPAEWTVGNLPVTDTAAAVSLPPVVTEPETDAAPERRNRPRRGEQEPAPAQEDKPAESKSEPAPQEAKDTPGQEQPKTGPTPVPEVEDPKPAETTNPPADEPKNEEKPPETEAAVEAVAEAEPAAVDPAAGLSPEAAMVRARELIAALDIPGAAACFKAGLAPDRDVKYTVSLGLYCLDGSVTSLVKRFSDEEVLVFSRRRGEQTCYFVCLGIFPDREAASNWLEAAGDLMDDSITPKIYRFDSFIPAP
jgi:outer membrane protein assembly factor BamB